ncbi:MAG: hypothetical protein AAFR45_03115 [Pseudomonadota bacterium]
MTLLLIISVLAAVIGATMPLRWGVFGFLGAAALLFAVQAGANTAMGFEGTSIEESLLLFNGSYASYVGFNLQITYRAFAVPLLLLGAVTVWRQSAGRFGG